jgi:sugar phosphate isomerase/epimerase
MYTLSVSNICFEENKYQQYYSYLKHVGIKNIEIAPTKLFGSWQINHDSILEIKKHDFKIISMQSLFYEKDFNFFDNEILFLQHFDKIFEICKILSCEYVVFGSPKNRYKPDSITEEEAYKKFNKIIEILFIKIKDTNIDIGIELNPEQYNCNFFNNIKDCFIKFGVHQALT